MMMPRLFLAKNLLRQDGVIFVSIDDNEVHNLKLLLNEIFGEENFINQVAVNMKNVAGASGGGEDIRLKKNIEHLLIYTKNYSEIRPFNSAYDFIPVHELVEKYKEEDISWKYTAVLIDEGKKEFLSKTVDGDGNDINIYKRINPVFKSISQIIREEKITEQEAYKKYAKKIFQTAMPQSSIRPRVMKKVNELGIVHDFFSIEYVPKSGRNKGILYEQFYKGDNFRLLAWLSDVSEEIDGVLYKKELKGTYWDFASETKNLTKEGGIPYPNGKKPLAMLKRIVQMATTLNESDIVLDFFAGSGTTAHAVIELNKDDGGNRKFINIQLDELIDDIDKVETYNAIEFTKLKTVADILKTRLSNVNKRIGAEIKQKETDKKAKLSFDNNEIEINLDLGYKVLKLEDSNFKQWQQIEGKDAKALAEQMKLFVDPVSESATIENMVYEILLKSGKDLNSSIEKKGSYYKINNTEMILLLEKATQEIIDAVIDVKPIKVIALDKLFKGNDQLKTNTVLQMKDAGIEFKTI
jgi:adenine-specific DNA-methyltransferase